MKEKVAVFTHGTVGKWCIHFNGIDFTDPEKECKAGIKILSVIADQPFQYRYEGDRTLYKSNKSMPCIKEHDPHGVCNCPRQQFPTQQEIDDENRDIEECCQRITIARKAIIVHAEGKRRTQGEIQCPICKTGMIHYSIASNGHNSAKCSTKKCVTWIE